MDEPESVLDDLDGIDFMIVSDVKTSKDHTWRVRVKASGNVYVVDEAVVCTHPDFDEKMRDFERNRRHRRGGRDTAGEQGPHAAVAHRPLHLLQVTSYT